MVKNLFESGKKLYDIVHDLYAKGDKASTATANKLYKQLNADEKQSIEVFKAAEFRRNSADKSKNLTNPKITKDVDDKAKKARYQNEQPVKVNSNEGTNTKVYGDEYHDIERRMPFKIQDTRKKKNLKEEQASIKDFEEEIENEDKNRLYQNVQRHNPDDFLSVERTGDDLINQNKEIKLLQDRGEKTFRNMSRQNMADILKNPNHKSHQALKDYAARKGKIKKDAAAGGLISATAAMANEGEIPKEKDMVKIPGEDYSDSGKTSTDAVKSIGKNLFDMTLGGDILDAGEGLSKRNDAKQKFLIDLQKKNKKKKLNKD